VGILSLKLLLHDLEEIVSIPFSSGRLFGPNQYPGLATSTGAFQSPFHRGGYSDTEEEADWKRWAERFNPLFIGAVIRTPAAS
jgi:hypothetical protein